MATVNDAGQLVVGSRLILMDGGRTDPVDQLCASMADLRKQVSSQAAQIDALRHRVADLEAVIALARAASAPQKTVGSKR
jgi:hypothetical protein